MDRSGDIVMQGVFEGESLPCSLVWDEVPDSVVWQTFDNGTRAPIGSPVTLSTPALEMEFVIPADRLPAGSSDRRIILVKVVATFFGGSTRPLVGLVTVTRIPAFAEAAP
jgi:hypothetical protein